MCKPNPFIMSDSEQQQLDAALDLLRRTDPRNVASNLALICRMNQPIAEELLSTVDQPLQVNTDLDNNKKYLCCDYNRDGDSYRSPHSNKYFPAIDDPIEISDKIRQLEVTLNAAFDTYRELYFEGGLSSCYLWDQEDGDNFAGVVLLQKVMKQSQWDSIHVLEVESVSGKEYSYKLSSTVILDIGHNSTKLGGSLTRQAEKKANVFEPQDHIANIGAFVEEMENRMRALLHEVYFGKTRDIIGDIRSIENLKEVRADEERKREIASGLGSRQAL